MLLKVYSISKGFLNVVKILFGRCVSQFPSLFDVSTLSIVPHMSILVNVKNMRDAGNSFSGNTVSLLSYLKICRNEQECV